MAKVHEQEHEEVDDCPDHPEPDWRTISMKNPILCKTLKLRIFWKLIPHHCKHGMASTYHISKDSASSYGSLVDRGANGGLAGADVCVKERTSRKISVTGIDDHNYLV